MSKATTTWPVKLYEETLRLAGLWKDADPGLPLSRKARLLRSSLDS